MKEVVVYHALLALHILPGIFHTLGFYLVYKVKTCLKNQRLLILNLAFTEMTICWLRVACIAIWLSTNGWPNEVDSVYRFFDVFLFGVFRLIIFHISVDRFTYIHLNIKYSLYMTRKIVYRILVLVYITSSILSAAMTILFYFHIVQELAWYYILLFVDTSITTFAIVTYVYMYYIVKGLKRREDAFSHEKRQNLAWTKFKIPCFMVTTFILFNFSGSIIRIIAFNGLNFNNKFIILNGISNLLDTLGWTVDSLIYVFLQKDVRKYFMSFLRRGQKYSTNTCPNSDEKRQRPSCQV